MEIPEIIGGQSVISIGNQSFSGAEIERLIIPDSVINVGHSAFASVGLRRVKFGKNVAIIDYKAFYSNLLKGIYLPASLDAIGGMAFYSNDAEEIYFYGNRPTLGTDAFGINRYANYFFCEGNSGWPGQAIGIYSETIPPQLDTVCDEDYEPGEFTYVLIDGGVELTGCKFRMCPKDLVLPATLDGMEVKSIGGWAFEGNYYTNLTSVFISNSVINIGRRAFRNNSLTSINIPESVLSIGESAFIGNNLANITVSENLPAESFDGLKNNTHSVDGDFTYIKVSENIVITGCNNDCPTILNIPSQIQEHDIKVIASNAFEGANITSVSIPNAVSIIGNNAFKNTMLTSVEIPNQVEHIGDRAFENSQLESLNIPDSVISIGEYAFINNNLFSVTIGHNVTSIGKFAFRANSIIDLNFDGDRPLVGDWLLDEYYPKRLTYCTKTIGWPGENSWPTYNLFPTLKTPCDSDNDGITNDFDDFPFDNKKYKQSVFDIDQNGSFDALTDGLILLRYAFGLRGDNLISGATASDATRTSASEIEAHIQSLLP